ncbi:nucleotidyltransferase [Caldicellulosiruptoraceae bacterium PP1]
MKVLGIVVEYNPFHNGHLYHLEKAKELVNPDVIIAVMSSNFIQRGEPSIVNKWARTKMALENGIDIVFELPFQFSCNSAEIFAYGAINILNRIGVTDIVFGSEIGNINRIENVAGILAFEEIKFKNSLRSFLEQGYSFPKARELALKDIYNINIEFLSNNILGIEYIKWILRLNSKIKYYTIQRIGNRYNDTDLSSTISSATSIRKYIYLNGLDDYLKNFIPQKSFEILQEEFINGRGPIKFDNCYSFLLYRYILADRNIFIDNIDVKEGLENRFAKYINRSNNVDMLIKNVKSKRYTYTRLSRIIIHSLIDTKIDNQHILTQQPYLRVLGFTQTGRNYLNIIKKDLDIITKIDNKVLKSIYKEQIELELKASRIYSLLYKNPTEHLLDEYKLKPIYQKN